MRFFLIILGIGIIFVMGALLLFYITLLGKGERHTAELIGIHDGDLLGATLYRHTMRVRFKREGNECETETLTAFTSVFFPERKCAKLRKRYLGKSIRIIYNPKNPSQTLVLEWLWKDFLICIVWIGAGFFSLLAGAFEWF